MVPAVTPADLEMTPPARPRSTATHRRQPASMSVPRRQDSRTVITPINQIQQRDSVQASVSSPGSNTQYEAGRRERSSGIGSAIKRLFGKRDKNDARRKSTNQPVRPSRLGQSSTDPDQTSTARSPIVEQVQRATVSPQIPRTPSPQNHPAYRLPYPMNLYKAPEANRRSPRRDEAEYSQDLQRRATLPNLMQPSGSTAIEREAHHRAGSDPVSAPAEVSTFPDIPDMIGLAVSSPPAQPNRRSRSVNDLFGSVRSSGEDYADRRRSAEMEYWRQSFTPSFMAKITRFIDERGGLVSGPSHDLDSPIREDRIPEETQEQPRVLTPFDFNNLRFGDIRTVPSLGQSPIDLDAGTIPVIDQRLSLLETNMQDLTNSLQELTGRAYPPVASREASPRIAQEEPERSDTLHNIDALPRMGLPANPRDTLAARMSGRPTQRAPLSPDVGDQDQLLRKDSFLPSPSTEGISQAAIATAFADMASRTPHRAAGKEKTSFSPQSLNLSPSKSSPHLRSATVPDTAYSSGASPPIPARVPPNPNLITTENIYTHLAPIYAALRYERQQRKDLESQVEILTKQVNDLATLLHRQSQQYSQQPIFRSPMSQQQGFSQPGRSLNVGGTASSAYSSKGLGLQPGYLTPRSEAASGSIYASSAGPGSSSASESRSGSMVTAPLAVMYPHYYHGQTQEQGRPYHAPPAGYARYEDSNLQSSKSPMTSRWSGYSERTQSSRFRSSVGTLGSEDVRELIEEDDEEVEEKDEERMPASKTTPGDEDLSLHIDSPVTAQTPSTVRNVERTSPPRNVSQIPIPSSKNNSPPSKIPKPSHGATRSQSAVETAITSSPAEGFRSYVTGPLDEPAEMAAQPDMTGTVEQRRLTQEGWVHAGNLTQFSPNPASGDDDIF